VMNFFIQSRFQDDKAEAGTAGGVRPHYANFCLNQIFGPRKEKTALQQACEALRVGESVHAEAAAAEVQCSHRCVIALGALQATHELIFGAVEVLLLASEAAQPSSSPSSRARDFIFTQLAAEGAARDPHLLGCEPAMPASLLKCFDDHLLFHPIKVHRGYGGFCLSLLLD